MSPSPRRLGDLKSRKPNSMESTAPITATHIDDAIKAQQQPQQPQSEQSLAAANPASATNTTTANDASGKFENISDNGSEISDEGYRSLGLIQQGTSQSKRTSLHSQTSIEDGKCDDAKTNGEWPAKWIKFTGWVGNVGVSTNSTNFLLLILRIFFF